MEQVTGDEMVLGECEACGIPLCAGSEIKERGDKQWCSSPACVSAWDNYDPTPYEVRGDGGGGEMEREAVIAAWGVKR